MHRYAYVKLFGMYFKWKPILLGQIYPLLSRQFFFCHVQLIIIPGPPTGSVILNNDDKHNSWVIIIVIIVNTPLQMEMKSRMCRIKLENW